MEGLENEELWQVLQFAEPILRSEIFSYFEWDRKVELLRTQDESQIADLLSEVSR